MFITNVNTGIAYRSDHSPVSVTFKFIDQERGWCYWKFNNSLLNNLEYLNTVNTCINETLDQYRVNETETNTDNFIINDQLLWETLKLMIRGKTISFATQFKRTKDEEEKDLERDLEALHYSTDNLNKENEIKQKETKT